MAGTSTQTAKAKVAPAAAGSSPATKVVSAPATRDEGALSGMPIDSAMESDIFAELGGRPASAKGDSAAQRATRAPNGSATQEETALTEGAETEEEKAAREEEEAEAQAAAAQPGETEDERIAREEAAAQESETEEEKTARETDAATEETETEEEKAAREDQERIAAEEGKTPEWAQKRFNELSFKLGQKDREIADLRRRLDGSPTVAPRTPQGAEAQVLQASTPQELASLRQHFEDLEDLAAAHPNGYEVPAKKEGDEPTVYTAEQMAQVRVNARKALRLIPQREQQIKVTQQHEAAAHQIYPGYENPESEESRSADFMLQVVPEIRRLPNWKQIVGDAVAGEKLRLAKTKAAAAASKGKDGQELPGKPAKQAVRRPPPSVPGAPHRAPSAPAPRVQQINKARERASRTGSEADVADLLELSLSPRG